MSDLRNRLADIAQHLEELEASARKLRNQNFADIVASAKGRVKQLSDHPDLELVNKEAGGEKLPFNPKAGADTYNPDPNGIDGLTKPGSEVGGPDRGKPDTYVPGAPRFDQPNANFSQPNAVDLNADGTVRQAPNSIGAQPDVRK